MSALAMRFVPRLVASWRELESQRLTWVTGASSGYLASGHVHKGVIIEKDFDNCQVRREGEAEEDADGADFVCRRVAKEYYLSPFGVFNRLNCVVLVGNIMTFLAIVLWLNKYQYLLTEEDLGKTMFPACGCQPNVSRSLKHD